jgi:hypothetical protein
MITIIVLLVIWVLVSFYKVVYKNEVDNMFYDIGLQFAIAIALVFLVFAIIIYLP